MKRLFSTLSLALLLSASSWLSAQYTPQSITTTSASTPSGCASIDVTENKGAVGFYVGGTWTGTLTPEVAIQGQPSNSAAASYVIPSTSSTTQTTITANGVYFFPSSAIAGASTAYICGPTSSGTALIWLNSSTALNVLPGSGGGGSGVTSFNGRTGAVTSTSGDYTCAEVTNCVGPLFGMTGAVTSSSAATSTVGFNDPSGASLLLGATTTLENSTGALFQASSGGAVTVRASSGGSAELEDGASDAFLCIPSVVCLVDSSVQVKLEAGSNTTTMSTTATTFLDPITVPSCTGCGGGTASWSALTNATANLTLANAGFTTTFNQTSAVAWDWENTTVATVSTTNASPTLNLSANYWTGSASAADTWTLGSSLTAGANGTPGLTFSHTGSTANPAIVLPSISTLSFGSALTSFLEETGTSLELADPNTVGIVIGSTVSANFYTSGRLTLGVQGTSTGDLQLTGASSGTISIQGQAAAGTYNFNLPTTAGTAGQFLTSQGGGSTAMTWTSPGTTSSNCAGVGTAANPSLVACTAASAGAFSCSVTASAGTCVVSTTAVTANSEILVTENTSESTRLGVTCNTSPSLVPTITLASKSAGTSFTINLPTYSTNPVCYDFFIIN